MIKTVLFDLDETLLDDERTALHAQGLVCRWAAGQRPGIDPRRLQENYHAASLAFWKHYDQARETRSGDELRRAFWLSGLRACNIDDLDFAETLSQAYNRFRDHTYEMFPDAVPCLDALKGRYRLGLVSNGATSIQMLKVHALHLDRWMDTVVIAEEVGVSKPDPGIFAAALQRLGSREDEAAMVGDLLDRDILGAINAGILPVWINRYDAGDDGTGEVIPATYHVNRRSTVPHPKHTIRTLAELPGVLEGLSTD